MPVGAGSQHALQRCRAAYDLRYQIFGDLVAAFILEAIAHVMGIRQDAPNFHPNA